MTLSTVLKQHLPVEAQELRLTTSHLPTGETHGYEFRYKIQGAEGSHTLTPWMFLSYQGMEDLMATIQEYMRVHGHLSDSSGSAPTVQ